MKRKNYKKHVPIPKGFHISFEGTKNMERCKNNGIGSTLYVYFHFNISCVQKHNREMNVEDIIIGEDTFTLLTPEHLQYLKQKGFLQTLVTKLKS